MRGLEVEVGHGLGVGQDAGGDHEGQHVHRDQQHRAHGERKQQALEEITVTDVREKDWSLTVGMLSSIWISTMATIAKPANRADVLLEALSLALLRLRFFQWKICSSIPLTDILGLK